MQGADGRAFKPKFSVVVVFYQHTIAVVGKVHKGLSARGRKNAPRWVLVRGRHIHKGAAGCAVIGQAVQLACVHALRVCGNAFNLVSRAGDNFHKAPMHGVFYQGQRIGAAEQMGHQPEPLRGPGGDHDLTGINPQTAHAQQPAS